MNTKTKQEIISTIVKLRGMAVGLQNGLDYLEGILDRPNEVRDLISAKETMRMLQVSRPTLRTYAAEGKIVQVNLSPRRIMFDRASVEAFINQGR